MICFDFQFFSIFEIAISNVMYNYHSNDFTNYGVIRLLFMSFNFSCFFQLQKPVGKVLVQIARIFKTEATQPPLMQLHHASSTLINVQPTYAN